MAKSGNRNYDMPWVDKRTRQRQIEEKRARAPKLLIASLNDVAKYAQEAAVKISQLNFAGIGRGLTEQFADQVLAERAEREPRIIVFPNKAVGEASSVEGLRIGDIGFDQESGIGWLLDKIEMLVQNGKTTWRGAWRVITGAAGQPLRVKDAEAMRAFLKTGRQVQMPEPKYTTRTTLTDLIERETGAQLLNSKLKDYEMRLVETFTQAQEKATSQAMLEQATGQPNELRVTFDDPVAGESLPVKLGMAWLKGESFEMAKLPEELQPTREVDQLVDGKLVTLKVNDGASMGFDEKTGTLFVKNSQGLWQPAAVGSVTDSYVDEVVRQVAALPDEAAKKARVEQELQQLKREFARRSEEDRMKEIIENIKSNWRDLWGDKSFGDNRMLPEASTKPESGRVIEIGGQRFIVSNGGKYLKNLDTGKLVLLDDQPAPQAGESEATGERYISLEADEV